MNERLPPEIGEREEDPVAEALLKAARGYRPPPRLQRRVQVALGLPVTLAVGTSAAAAASSAATSAAASASASASATFASVTAGKAILAVAAVVVGLGGGGVVTYRAVRGSRPAETTDTGRVSDGLRRKPPHEMAPPSPAVPDTDPAPDPATAARGAGAASVTARRRRAPAVPAPAPAAARTPASPAPPPASEAPAPAPAAAAVVVPPPPPMPTTRPPAALAAEIAVLDRAQAAARHHDHRETLARIAEHDRSFPAGALADEAEVLRIGALLGVGQRAMAAARARRFLDRDGDGILAERVRSMLSAQVNDNDGGRIR